MAVATSQVVKPKVPTPAKPTAVAKPYTDTNAEIARTKQVIADRTAAGQDLTKQYEHFKNLTGQDYKAPEPPKPTPAPFQFNYNYMNYDSAKSQAEQQFNPLYEQAIKNIKGQQYQNEVASGEVAANRGIAQSGLAADALNKIKIASQGQIADANTQRMSQIAALSQQMMERDQDRGDRLRSQAFSEYANNRDFDYGQQRDQVNDGWRQTEFDYQKALDTWNQNRTTQRDQRADMESDRGYNYQTGRDKIADSRYNQEWNYNVGRDKVADSQWQQQFNEDVRRFGLNYALDKQREARIGSGGGGGSNGYPSGGDNSPKSKDQSYSDWLGYFNQNSQAIANMGLPQFEKQLRENSSMIKQIQDQGYNIDAVMDALYAGSTGGRFRTKKEYDTYLLEQEKLGHTSGGRATR